VQAEVAPRRPRPGADAAADHQVVAEDAGQVGGFVAFADHGVHGHQDLPRQHPQPILGHQVERRFGEVIAAVPGIEAVEGPGAELGMALPAQAERPERVGEVDGAGRRRRDAEAVAEVIQVVAVVAALAVDAHHRQVAGAHRGLQDLIGTGMHLTRQGQALRVFGQRQTLAEGDAPIVAGDLVHVGKLLASRADSRAARPHIRATS